MVNLNNKHILIESGGGVGDLIMFTPALRRLKEKYPQSILTFLTIDKTADVINRLPYIDKVICIKRGRWMGRYRVIPELMKQDYMIFTEWQPHLLCCAWLLKLPNRFSVPRAGHLLTKTLHKHITHIVSSSPDFAAQTNAKLIGDALNITLDGDMTQCDVSLPTEKEKTEVDSLLRSIGIYKDEPFIALSPFTSADGRDWPLDQTVKLINKIKKKYCLKTVLIGNKETAGISYSFDYSLLGKTNIIQLVEVIRRSKCLITPDSGPMHIAGALHVPCIALFSRDLPSRWAPKYYCYPIYLQYTCSPCESEMFRHCPYEFGCIRHITAEMVMKKLKMILG